MLWNIQDCASLLIITRINNDMVNGYTILILVGVGAIATMGVIFGLDIAKLAIASQEYELFVDPIIDKQNLFIAGRVTIQNTGSQPLTNVIVNFGDGDIVELGSIAPREKLIVSPPSDNSMQFVQVSAEPDIFVNKAYREPPKMVGMMGS